MAQNPPPLNFENNYFVTGDYVVGGVALRGIGVNGYATGTITIPDANTVPSTGVPAGADIVAAFLYWQTVESSQTAMAGQIGWFNGYPIAGYSLGNPNAPVSWSSGGCTGSSNGSKTLRTYRADVRSLLKQDPATGKYVNVVTLADSGSNGGTAPLGLGASLVIIYRVVDKTVPLNSIVFYDDSYSPTNGAQTTTQGIQGFYEAAASPVAKLTHIVSSGQTNKKETVYLNGVTLPSLYSSNGTVLPPFPGYYNSSGKLFNGSWDNPTWVVNNYGPAVKAEDSAATAVVVPNSSNSGCVSWGVMIMSTTVQDSDNDGLLDAWEKKGGYCDAAVNNGSCAVTDPSWVPLPNADPAKPDVFVEADSMCSGTVSNNVCDTSQGGVSYYPQQAALDMVTAAFAANNHNVNLHIIPGNVIPEPTCTDNYSVSPPKLCQFPNQPGVVGWKGGFEFLKNQPLNYPDETSCENPTTAIGPCIRRFQHGKKDSYHYVIFGHAAGTASWSLQDGSLTSVVVASNGAATFYTSTAPSLLSPGDQVGGFGRITVGDAITNPNLNGTWFVQSVNLSAPYSFTVQTTNVPQGTYTKNSDPNLAVAMGQAGTISGVSDIGGGDTLVSLGSWGADGQAVNVQAGTFMHELGHSLALTHGGYYYDHYNDVPNQPSYVPTFEANCKPNFQSVMNYLFQVDLLDGAVDFSEQQIITLNETSLSGVAGLTDYLNGSATTYSSTTWYALTPPNGVGHAATRHCDGTPKLPGETMYRVSGPTAPLSWVNSDINFDGNAAENMRGYSDWANIDLRQIGATGSASVAGGILLGGSGGILLGGSGGIVLGGSGGIVLGGSGGILLGGSGGISLGGSGGIVLGGSGGIVLGGSGGVGQGEITNEVANSIVRPPTNLTPTPTDTRTSHSVLLNWHAPIFGQIASYNVYRVIGAPPDWPRSVVATNTTDSAVTDCTTYTYYVSSILASDGRESVPSNSVQYAVPCPASGLTASQSVSNNMGAVTLNWTAASSASGPVYGYNIYRDNGTTPLATVLAASPTNYTDSTVSNNTTYTYYVTAVLADQQGCSGNQHCRESSQVSVTITVQFKLQQTITFAPLPDKTYGDADFAVNATASSGLPVSFSASPSANCTVSGNTVHIVHAGSCTITASQAGNDTYYPAPDVPQTFTIQKANPKISVTGYSVTYDGNAHTATGSATGVFNEALSGLDLSGTTHTNAGNYNDAWTFTDVTGNYNNANGVVADSIAKANPTISVVGYTVTYDGNAHTATGSATGVKGEALSGLNLSGTTHTSPGTYSDAWTFTDVTGNYNNAAGMVTDTIIKGNSTTAITSINPSPSILGQSFTVNFTVSAVSGFGTPTGSVTVSDVSGANCNGALSGGKGSCVLTLPVFAVNGLSVVGTRALTANYPGDANFTGSQGFRNQQVIYNFVGFLTPLKLGAYSGSFNLGKAIPIKWQLLTSSGGVVGMSNLDLTKVSLLAYFNGPPVNGGCQPPVVSTTSLILFSGQTGATGNSTFRFGSGQFIFNWDTTVSDGPGCYTLSLQLDDGSTHATSLQLH